MLSSRPSSFFTFSYSSFFAPVTSLLMAPTMHVPKPWFTISAHMKP